jgi:hypothetical protein
MHGIKYFFLKKNNQTIQGGKKNFQGGQITENITEKHYFSKSKGGTCPPWIKLGPPLHGASQIININRASHTKKGKEKK